MSFNLSILRKIRCRFLNRATGSPVAGVIANLSVSVGDDDAVLRIPVGTLCSDRTGYASFDLKPLIDRGLDVVQGVSISAISHGLRQYDVLQHFVSRQLTDGEDDEGDAVEAAGSEAMRKHMLNHLPSVSGVRADPLCIVFPVYVEEPADKDHDCTNGCTTTALASIQSPDACDYKVSPYSFVSPTEVNVGGDCCETLVPSTLPVQEHGFYKVVVRHSGNFDDDGSTDMMMLNGSVEEADVTDALETRSPRIKFGEVLEYRQRWYSLGHSLGEIKYSLPLAPGESTQLAVIDWSRQDTASRFDRLRGTEFLDHELKRDRTIEETIEAALHENQSGWSWMGGFGTASNYDAKAYGNYSGTGAVGGSVTNTWGNRDIEGESLQDLDDKVTQATSYVRSLSSTVIVQASQAEQNFLQTRRVANHNHCHSLTIQYYEVLRHFRLETEFNRRRNAVLVPFSPFAFSWQTALRFRTQLEQALLDERLMSCFDAIIRLRIASEIYEKPSETAPDPGVPKPPAVKKVPKTKMITVDGKLESGIGSGVIVNSGDAFSFNASGAIKFSNWAHEGAVGPSGDTNAAGAGAVAPTLRSRSLIYKIGPAGSWVQGGTYAGETATVTGELVFGVNDTLGGFWDNSGSWSVTINYLEAEDAGPQPPKENPLPPEEEKKSTFSKVEDQLCEARLLTHLAANQGYYNRAVWLLIDATERRLYLESVLAGNPAVLAGLDDKPLTVSGNYVAFEYFGPIPAPTDDTRITPEEPIESIVTLPTRGLFAEAQMGNCNSCEKRDVTRMWDWTEMTAEEPPAISGIEPGPQGTAASLTPLQLPSNVIQITQPQNAPDPTGLATALGVLGKPDLFRDMSGLDEVSELLGKLADGAVTSLEGAKKVAAEAKAKVDKAKSTGTSSNGSDGSSGKRTQPNEKDAKSQLDKLQIVDEAKQRDLVNDEQATNATLGILGGEIIPAAAIDRNVSMPMGIDVSHHQGIINWEKVASSNIYFAFIRTSDGQMLDKKFQANWTAARDAGITCGAYHFWRPQISGKKQAETVIKQLGFLQRGDLPPVIDVEKNAKSVFTGLSVTDIEDNIQEFLDTLQTEFGVSPIIYTNPDTWNDTLGGSTKFSNYLLWISNYSPKNDPTLPGGWPTWEFWQMTDSGRVDGVSGLVDMNMFNGDLESLWLMARKTPNVIEI